MLTRRHLLANRNTRGDVSPAPTPAHNGRCLRPPSKKLPENMKKKKIQIRLVDGQKHGTGRIVCTDPG